MIIIPLTSNVLAFAFSVTVMVLPAQMITSSAAPGIDDAAVPPHAAVDQEPGEFQFPFVLE